MYFHVDLDAFFASVEQVDNPGLAGVALIVGGRPGSRGVVASCSYEARRFGVRSAMPTTEAHRRCPHAIFVPARMQRYAAVSGQIMEILGSFTPAVQPVSVDEAFLDVTGTHRLFGREWQLAAKIKQTVKDRTSLTLSIGGGSNRFVAKLASEAAKPDGLLIVALGDEERFVGGLSPPDLWGVGARTLDRLRQQGVSNMETLRSHTHASLQAMFGEGTGTYLYRACRGQELGIRSPTPRNRSASAERTFASDSKDPRALRRQLLALSHRVMERMLTSGLQGRTVTLKLRYADFTTFTCRHTLDKPVESANRLFQEAATLLDSRWDHRQPLRLLGVGLSGVGAEGSAQLSLFDQKNERVRAVERIAAVLNRGAQPPLTKASLLEQPGTAPPSPDRG